MSTAETDYLFKVVLIGDPAVGKTNLLLRFADDRFDENYTNTIGVDFKFRNIRLDGKTIKLQLWDTAGQDRFRSIARSFYRGAHGIIVVYDVTRRTSFQSVDKWLQEVELHNSGRRIPRLLVGNKCDLTEKAVDYGTAKAYADRMGMLFVETSARQSANVEQAFFYLAAEMKQQEASNRAATEVEGRYSYNSDPPIAITSTQPLAVGSSSRRNCC